MFIKQHCAKTWVKKNGFRMNYFPSLQFLLVENALRIRIKE
jgi:hypothetical protein